MSLLQNMKTMNKMILFIIISTISIAYVGVSGYFQMKNMSDNSDYLYSNRLVPITIVEQIKINNQTIATSILELMLATDEKTNKELSDKISEAVASNDELLKEYKSIELLVEEKQSLKIYEEKIKTYRDTRKKAIELALNNQNEESYKIYQNEVSIIRQQIDTTLDEIISINQKAAQDLNKQNKENLKSSTMTLIMIILISTGVSVLIAFLITRLIVKPLQHLQTVMKQAEEGDFTIEGNYQSKDEIGVLTNSFNNMIVGLRKIIRNINLASQQVTNSSEELAASAEQSSAANQEVSSIIQELSVGADKQSKNTDETSKIIDNITKNVNHLKLNAQSVLETAIETSTKSRDGLETIEVSIQQMNDINENVVQLAKIIETLGSRSIEINKIINVISDIADQTNLLALNAAIEAARAGEHGKGFSVVADEVRKLAEQSSHSTNHISDLIFAIQDETNNAVHSMEETANKVTSGIEIVGSAGDTFKTIQNSIQELTAQVENVSSAMVQMATSTEQVNDSIKTVAQIAENAALGTQSVSASSEEQAASAQEITSSAMNLANVAEDLQQLINKFKI